MSDEKKNKELRVTSSTLQTTKRAWLRKRVKNGHKTGLYIRFGLFAFFYLSLMWQGNGLVGGSCSGVARFLILRCLSRHIFLSRFFLWILSVYRRDDSRVHSTGEKLLPDRTRLPSWGWHCTPAGRRSCSLAPRSCKSRFCHKDSPEPCTR